VACSELGGRGSEGMRRRLDAKGPDQSLRLHRHRMATATSLLVIGILYSAHRLGALPRAAFFASTCAILRFGTRTLLACAVFILFAYGRMINLCGSTGGRPSTCRWMCCIG